MTLFSGTKNCFIIIIYTKINPNKPFTQQHI
jgi:hypothetical protein